LLDMEEEGKEIVFWNKCDLGEDSKWGIWIRENWLIFN
jgi:hypothetical protein